MTEESTCTGSAIDDVVNPPKKSAVVKHNTPASGGIGVGKIIPSNVPLNHTLKGECSTMTEDNVEP